MLSVTIPEPMVTSTFSTFARQAMKRTSMKLERRIQIHGILHVAVSVWERITLFPIPFNCGHEGAVPSALYGTLVPARLPAADRLFHYFVTGHSEALPAPSTATYVAHLGSAAAVQAMKQTNGARCSPCWIQRPGSIRTVCLVAQSHATWTWYARTSRICIVGLCISNVHLRTLR
jgi:hypothetical protein